MILTYNQFLVYLAMTGLSGGDPGAGALLAANNLSDVPNKPLARTHMSVPAVSTYVGNPNGHVAGAIGDFVVDTADKNILFLCTTAGGSSSAVWVAQIASPPIVATGATQQMISNQEYIANRGTPVTFTLPVLANVAIGDILPVTGLGTGLFIIQCNAGQIIVNLNQATSSGGALASTQRYQKAILECIATNIFSLINPSTQSWDAT